MVAFWNKGYEATSMAELCNCTGLHKGSLYQAFGDKHTLFMRALKHYSEQQFAEVAAVASRSESPLENLRAVVEKICEHGGHEDGCMMINSLVELAPHDPDVKAMLRGLGERRIGFVTALIAAAKEQGELSIDVPPDQLGRQLMLTIAGGAVMVKGLIDQAAVQDTLKKMIDSWV